MPTSFDRRWRLLAATGLTSSCLALAACGGGDAGSAASTATASPGATSASALATTDTGGSVAAATGGTPPVEAASTREEALAAPSASPVTPPVRAPARSGGTLLLHIDGPVAGVSHDVLNVAGTANLAGTLRLEFGDDYTPVAGQRFTVISAAGGITGQRLTVTNNKSLPLALSQDAQNVYVTVGN